MARRRFFRDAGPAQRTRVNHMIRISPIRVIDENNEQLGVIETHEALRRAEEAGLDLVEVSPEARPPVCKIMDYGKFKYEQSKKDQKTRSAAHKSELKEVRLGRSIKIDPHDVKIRVDQARRFLLEGHKVLLVQQFRGREMQHRDLGQARLREIIESLSDIAKVETPPKSAGRRITLILAPDRPKVDAYKRKHASGTDASKKAGDKPAATPHDEPDTDDASAASESMSRAES